jgi:hypothetical protein
MKTKDTSRLAELQEKISSGEGLNQHELIEALRLHGKKIEEETDRVHQDYLKLRTNQRSELG